MSTRDVEHAELLAAAAYATRAAADLLAGVTPAEIRSKGDPTDLVTEWDLRTEELIRAALAERTPGVPVLGEEAGGADGVAGELRWVVDPIDGTVNFAHGLPIWTVSIACERVGGDTLDPTAPPSGGASRLASQTLVGVVFAPRLGWWFEATRGGGARDEHGQPLRVSAIATLGKSLLSTGFPYDRATSPQNNFAEWEHLQRRAGACRRLGAASLDLCLVARGWIEGYWERKLKAWDVAAGALVVAEAGGIVTDWRGGAFDVHRGEVVATNGAIHEQLVAELGKVTPRPPIGTENT